MQELSLMEIKEIELDILKHFHSFCLEHNIRYYLAYGTLLGAIRYKKFIPWDDDVDVLMPREDYNRFVRLFKDNGKYKLYSFERNKKFFFPFAKLCDDTTRKVEPNYDNGVALGLDIDIFPLDHWDNDLNKAKKECARILKYMRYLNCAKCEKITNKHLIKHLLLNMIALFHKIVGRGHYVRKMIKESFKEEQSQSAYVGAKSWCVYGEKGIIPAEAFASAVEVEFEGLMLPSPVGYDSYLTCLYGDYLPEPPKEKQRTHHSFKAYRL